jgi:hypothetical protein
MERFDALTPGKRTAYVLPSTALGGEEEVSPGAAIHV